MLTSFFYRAQSPHLFHIQVCPFITSFSMMYVLFALSSCCFFMHYYKNVSTLDDLLHFFWIIFIFPLAYNSIWIYSPITGLLMFMLCSSELFWIENLWTVLGAAWMWMVQWPQQHRKRALHWRVFSGPNEARWHAQQGDGSGHQSLS